MKPEWTNEEGRSFRGQVVIRCVAAGGMNLAISGEALAEGVDLDILDPLTPQIIRAWHFHIAKCMVEDPGCEIKQAIDAGDVILVAVVRPDYGIAATQ